MCGESTSVLWRIVFITKLKWLHVDCMYCCEFTSVFCQQSNPVTRSLSVEGIVKVHFTCLNVDCEQSLFSQSSLSSAGLERAKWPRGKLFFTFARFTRFPRSRDHASWRTALSLVWTDLKHDRKQFPFSFVQRWLYLCMCNCIASWLYKAAVS